MLYKMETIHRYLSLCCIAFPKASNSAVKMAIFAIFTHRLCASFPPQPERFMEWFWVRFTPDTCVYRDKMLLRVFWAKTHNKTLHFQRLPHTIARKRFRLHHNWPAATTPTNAAYVRICDLQLCHQGVPQVMLMSRDNHRKHEILGDTLCTRNSQICRPSTTWDRAQPAQLVL